MAIKIIVLCMTLVELVAMTQTGCKHILYICDVTNKDK